MPWRQRPGRRGPVAGIALVRGDDLVARALEGGHRLRPRVWARAAGAVVLEHDRPRGQRGEARVGEQRPLPSLDIDLDQVGALELGEGVHRLDLDRARISGPRRPRP